jgi:hypothetical protein
MATEKNPPNPARDLVRIHKVITRSLKVVIERGADFHRTDFPNGEIRQGFIDYANCVAIVLESHHLAEDDIFFPAMREKFPLAPYERLSAVHQEIQALLVPVRQAVADLNVQGNGNGLPLLVDTLRKIAEAWPPHMRMEESIFSAEALSEGMDPETLAGLSGAMGKFASEHSNPPYLTVPFILFNLQPADRALWLEHTPPALMDEMVMKAWKDQWAPLKPFLLE